MSSVNFVLPSDHPTEEEILGLVTEDLQNVPYSKATRLTLLKQMYSVLGYNLDSDSMLAILDESNVKLLIACAGAGKTTTIINNSVLEKMTRNSRIVPGQKINGFNMLCLVYNKANRQDVKRKHAQTVATLKNRCKGLDFLDLDFNTHTFHSFCLEWINPKSGPYAEACGLMGCTLLSSDYEQQQQMVAAITTVHRRTHASWDPEMVNASALLNLYNYLRENMLEVEDAVENDKFIDIGLDCTSVKQILNFYDDLKLQLRYFDYSDVLIKFYELLKNNEEAAKRIRAQYEFILADEVQDVTPLLMRILREISYGNTLICVGDDDQCIYSFRGASNKNLLDFGELFPEHKAFMLNTNRRCPSNITALASEVLTLNSDRFPKQLKSCKPEGGVEFRSYSDTIGQYMSVAQKLKGMSQEELQSTVVCYRNRSSSALLVDILAMQEKEIPFHVISGYQPFSYKLYDAVLSVLKALAEPTSKVLLLNLFKALPIKRAEWFEILGYHPKTNSFDVPVIRDLDDLDLGRFQSYQTFVNVWNSLKAIAKNVNNLTMDKYFDNVLEYIYAYYWNFVRDSYGYDLALDAAFKQQISSYFSKPFILARFLTDFELLKNSLQRARQLHKGVAFSTFHALKGLEFDHVILIDLKEEIFPNLSGIQSRGYDSETQKMLLECETRLMYVALTRAKKSEMIYYSKQDPSIYVSHLLSTNITTSIAEDHAEEAKESVDELLNQIAPQSQQPHPPLEEHENVEIDKAPMKPEARPRNPILGMFING